jgi:hypothetical protein
LLYFAEGEGFLTKEDVAKLTEDLLEETEGLKVCDLLIDTLPCDKKESKSDAAEFHWVVCVG